MTPPAPPSAPPAAPTSGRERRKRHDGSEIDPVASLADFVQSFAPSSSEPPDDTLAPPPPPVQITAPTGYEGKSPEQIIAEAAKHRDRATELERSNAELTRAANERRQQDQIDEAARKAVTEQAAKNAPPPAAPPPDPRLEEIQEKWFTDPARAQQLMTEINDERMQKKIDEARGTIRQELTTEQQAANQRSAQETQRAQGMKAFDEAMEKLRAAGVSEADLTDFDKITAVYTVISRNPTAARPNPYHDRGGPTNADVIVDAWRHLNGAGATAPPPAVAPPPPPQPPQITAPPGSGRPAPAAEPPRRERAMPVSADQQRDITYMAESFGLSPEKLINRRRARLERDKGNS